MSPFRRAVSEGSNRHHRCVVQHHGLKTSDTFMALFLGYYFACLGMSQATRWLICQQTHIHTIYAYIYTHTVISRIKKHHDMYRGFREIRRDIRGHLQPKNLHRHPHGGSTQSWSCRNTEEASFVVSVASFLYKRGKDWSLDVPYVYWNGDLKGWKSSSIKFLFSFLDCNVWTHQAEAIATPYTMILPRAWMPRLAGLWSRMWHLGWIEFSSVWYSPTTWQEDICVAWGRFLVDWVLVL